MAYSMNPPVCCPRTAQYARHRHGRVNRGCKKTLIRCRVPGAVFTDAYSGGWIPKTDGKPFMTGIITFEEEDGQTRYTARVRLLLWRSLSPSVAPSARPPPPPPFVTPCAIN